MQKIIRPNLWAFIPSLFWQIILWGIIGAGCYKFLQGLSFFRGYNVLFNFTFGIYSLCTIFFLYRSFTEIFGKYLVVTDDECILHSGIFVTQQVHTSSDLITGFEVNSNFIQKMFKLGNVTLYFINGYFVIKGVSIQEIQDVFLKLNAQKAYPQ